MRVFFSLALLLSSLAWGTTGFAAGHDAGAVYALTNSTAGNSVQVFNRAADGTLTPGGSYSTSGTGTGTGLGSQGAVVLSENNQWLFAVNAGSNEISAFSVNPSGLTLMDKVASGGIRPISLTANHDLLYVLNAGGTGNITGFTVGHRGTLSMIPGSTRPLSNGASGPAQVQFSPNGDVLVVTEKNTNLIDTYTVGKDGLATGPVTHPSSGTTPFGFAFGQRNQMFVSEAFGGATNGSAVSSYTVSRDGGVQVDTPSATTHQTAACWVAVTNDGRYAYAANAGSGSVTGYAIAQDGSISLLNADGRTGVIGDGSSPVDMAISNNSRYLYVLAGGFHSVAAFQVGADGSLTPIAGAGGLPAGAAGLAAR
jgi:6-phosphogluconolactonase